MIARPETTIGHLLPFAWTMRWSLERPVHSESRPILNVQLSAIADVRTSILVCPLTAADRPLSDDNAEITADFQRTRTFDPKHLVDRLRCRQS
jgi:hypothetical protein